MTEASLWYCVRNTWHSLIFEVHRVPVQIALIVLKYGVRTSKQYCFKIPLTCTALEGNLLLSFPLLAA